ncbi:hypothetical protein FGKAn22_12460 [Ferrigenium kumadai]|uniref:Uncharacterized protein n=1 Tax=Ferrigenium kumadai TaxID=1682490 RepID=A0AAN1SYR5_9PROT|nr:hypothetical protein [Ferrigenium kumadai]BBI99553.1 hypothetical protein FGKAn22_12460 [Ferrigenium kumadai]
MGVLTMHMSGYEVERGDVAESRYDDEVLCAGWVPTLSMHQAHPEQTSMPRELATTDIEAFLRKMYAFQR